MKRIVGLLIAVFLISATSLAFAQPMKGRGMGGWGMGTKYQRMYNPATVETLTGTVEAVEKIMPMRGMSYGIHLLVKTDKESIPVHLGPAWYIDKLDVKFDKGDTITVKGSRVTVAEKPAVIAAEVTKGDKTVTLRDDKGVPAWAGAGRRR
ncbi:MAG: DNA-binding protein [Nitrospirota bacterium]